jgi:hypothetical protein
MTKLINLIERAFCWEGDADAYLKKSDDPLILKFAVSGSSTCEHGGDESNIRANVSGLRGQVVEEDGVRYTIISTEVNLGSPDYDEEDEDRDGEYSISVSGSVVVKKEKI